MESEIRQLLKQKVLNEMLQIESQSKEDDGLIPRCLKLIFKVFKGQHNTLIKNNHELRLSYMAVNDTEVIDLMSLDSGINQQTMADFQNEITEVKITSYEIALDIL